MLVKGANMERTTIMLLHDLKAKASKWRKAMIFFDQHFECAGFSL
jgi:hypothetical protein